MKVASAILKLERVYIQGYAKTTLGVWIGHGPVYVSTLSSLAEMAVNIRRALEGSVQGIAHPNRTEWKGVQQPMLKAVGATTWSGLAKGTKAVGIECDSGVVTLTPSLNYAKQGGMDVPEHAIRVSISADDLGARLAEAFSLSS